jgi:DNA (cytosine-5)-methyltransferase 1
VKQLATHDKKRTINRILETLEMLGYKVYWNILNALHYGLPQKRERTIIVGFLNHNSDFLWPNKISQYKKLEEILEQDVDKKYLVSERIQKKRIETHTSKFYLSIWHENKAGNISSYPYSCALRAGASYNYLLVNGKRRLTPREMLRLQGFPDSFEIVCSDTQTRKQAGNAVPVPMIEAVIGEVLNAKAKAERLQIEKRDRAVSDRRVSAFSYLRNQ